MPPKQPSPRRPKAPRSVPPPLSEPQPRDAPPESGTERPDGNPQAHADGSVSTVREGSGRAKRD